LAVLLDFYDTIENMNERHLSVNISQKALIVVNGKVLLVKEDEWWELPGGRVDEGEVDLVEALRRELREELSVEVDVGDLYSAYLHQKRAGGQNLMLVYQCQLKTPLEAIKIQDADVLDWKLFSKGELIDGDQIYHNSQSVIKKFCSSK
jgi:ADP-ribose pyrophosphatase YjhB (NUDIX family)